jgi:hypothetical protein
MDRLASVLRRNLHREYPCLELYLGFDLMQIVLAYKLMIMTGVILLTIQSQAFLLVYV